MEGKVLSPTAGYMPFSGRVSIRLYGRISPPILGGEDMLRQPWNVHDWAIKDRIAEETRANIAGTLRQIGVKTVSAPRPQKFNAVICEPGDLTGDAVSISSDVTFMRGLDADGVVVPVETPFWLSSADCLTLVVIDPKTGMTIASHAGRDCLFDRERIYGRPPSREHESVVDAIITRFKAAHVNAKYLQAFMTCGVGPEHFEHDWGHRDVVMATRNQAMCAHVLMRWGTQCLDGDLLKGKLVLTEIVRAQLVKHGVRVFNIGFDVVDTYDDVNVNGDHLWWSNRRGDGDKRNGVLVTRNW